jgi:hypothetical protein
VSPAPDVYAPGVLENFGPLLSAEGACRSGHDLIPYEKASAPRGSMSAITGTDAQPMHTDCAFLHAPPRYTALQCMERGEARCPTNVWSVNTREMQRSQTVALSRVHVVSGGRSHPPFYSPILDMIGGIARLRFDSFCMRPVSGADCSLDEARGILESCSQHIEFEWRNGDLLILDNWRCLHGRSKGADQAPSRRLRRWMIGTNHGLVL